MCERGESMSTTQPKITAIAPWFGGKRTLAPAIVQELGKHNTYWEPFCGSLAVLMAKPAVRQETAIDKHYLLTNLARVLAQPVFCQELYRRAVATLTADQLYWDAMRYCDNAQLGPEACDLDAAYHFLVACWPLRWDSDCEGALCNGGNRHVALFENRADARTAITISRKFAELQKSQGKVHNSDFLNPDIKHVKIMPCE